MCIGNFYPRAQDIVSKIAKVRLKKLRLFLLNPQSEKYHGYYPERMPDKAEKRKEDEKDEVHGLLTLRFYLFNFYFPYVTGFLFDPSVSVVPLCFSRFTVFIVILNQFHDSGFF